MASVSTFNRKRKRLVLTISDKLKICQLVRSGRTLQSVADEYDVGKSTVHNIVKSEEKLQAFQKEIKDGDCIKKRKTVKKADLLALDKAVYLWFIQQRCKGTPISGPLLMSKALQLYLSQQKRSWQIWSGLYNITVEILRVLTIKLTQARARTRARTRARARARAMARDRARTTNRPRPRAMVSSRARAWECVYV